MASLIQAIVRCLNGLKSSKANTSTKDKAIILDMLQILFTIEQGGYNLKKALQESIRGYR